MTKSKIFLKEEIIFHGRVGKDVCFPFIIVDVNGEETQAALTWDMIRCAEKMYKQIFNEDI